jgi:tripartite-type tricarboxylate transporter receptor subunit TctC
MKTMLRLLASLLGLVGCLQHGATAQEPTSGTDFYRNKQITFVVSTGPASGFDSSARLIARHLPRFIPGGPSIIVRNMPGAGGLVATNWLYNVAHKDGLNIGMINTNLAFNPLFGDRNAQFNADKFNWLGSPSKETALFVTWHTSPFDSIATARSRQMALGATAASGTPAIYARVLSYVLDMPIKLVLGYQTQNEALLGMERGENDGVASPYWSSLKAEKAEWLADKKIRVMTYWGAERIPDIPGPYIFDLITDDGKKEIMEVAQAGLGMGRPVVAPPGVSQQNVSILRNAFESVFKDSAYLAECVKVRLECAYPSSGKELLTLIQSTYAQPKAAVDKVAAIFGGG